MKYVNRNKPDKWKKDIACSVDFYNQWFLEFAPITFRETRIETTKEVEIALKRTENLLNLNPRVLSENPNILAMLRMSTCPPIARDRLIGLSYVAPNLVKSLELNKLPIRMDSKTLTKGLTKICDTIQKLIDPDIYTWIEKKDTPTKSEVERAATIVADRLCGAVADPIVRNAQEKRQLSSISQWLEEKNYRKLEPKEAKDFREFPKGTYAFHYNVPVILNEGRNVKIPVDIIINPHKNTRANIPVLIEAKSAGDFTNVNKRRKEEAVKMSQLKNTYGDKIQFVLFLCGYFDSGYLGYEAAEGIDWVWEHRINDFSKLGL